VTKTVEMSLRVASLDYLGVVAAKLRKDAVTSHKKNDLIDDIIKDAITDWEESENDVLKYLKVFVKYRGLSCVLVVFFFKLRFEFY